MLPSMFPFERYEGPFFTLNQSDACKCVFNDKNLTKDFSYLA